MLTNVLNPKATAVAFLAFLPQFATPSSAGASVASQMLVLGLILALMALSFLCAVALLSGARGVPAREQARPPPPDGLHLLGPRPPTRPAGTPLASRSAAATGGRRIVSSMP